MSAVAWGTLFRDLAEIGYSTYRIAGAVGIPRTTLDYFRSGGEPKYSDGELLLRFWARTTGKNLDSVPREQELPRVARRGRT